MEEAKQPISNKSRNWAMACHLIAFLGALGIQLGNLLGPLVLWLIFRKEDA